MENFNELVQSNSPEKDLRSAVLTLCVNLKIFGAQLEMNCKGKIVHRVLGNDFFWKCSSILPDQLDRVFIHLRNTGRDDSLDKISRLHLLEVVELRASRWAAQEQVSNYYQSKLNELVGFLNTAYALVPTVDAYYYLLFMCTYIISFFSRPPALPTFRRMSAKLQDRTNCRLQLALCLFYCLVKSLNLLGNTSSTTLAAFPRQSTQSKMK